MANKILQQQLSSTGVEALVKGKKFGKHHDGAGLYLIVDEHGARWLSRLSVGGRRIEVGLGTYGQRKDETSLADARRRHLVNRAKAKEGIDPAAERRAKLARQRLERQAAEMPSLWEISNEVYEQRRKAFVNDKHSAQWIGDIRREVLEAHPAIAAKRVGEITSGDVLTILSPIWSTKPDTASKLKQRLYTILQTAQARGYCVGANPVEMAATALPKFKKSKEHHASLPYQDVATFLRKLREGAHRPVTKLAFEFMILTAVRTKEVRFAKWSEVDVEKKLWTIPASRMGKTGMAHKVPLSDRAIGVLQAIGPTLDKSLYIFRDPETNKTLSENAFTNAISGLDYKEQTTGHGFRGSFRTWANEVPVQVLSNGQTVRYQHTVCEACLSHTIPQKEVAAYLQTHGITHLEAQRELMDKWAAYIEPAKAAAANVVPMVRAVS